MKRIKKSFREKALGSYRQIVEKHRFARIPAFLCFGLLLAVHGVCCAFVGGAWKKYAFVSFLVANILIGSSFAYPVFGEWDMSAATPEELPLPEETLALSVYGDESGEFLDDTMHDMDEFSVFSLYSVEEILAGFDFENRIDTSVQDGYHEALPSDSSDVRPHFSADDWRLILINKQHPIPDSYEFTLGTITGNMQCDERIIEDLMLMMQAALQDGIHLVIASPYRGIAHQERLFKRRVDSYVRGGLSYLDAYKRTAQTINVPGSSEHEAGLALDIVSRDYRYLNAAFFDTAAGQWLSAHSYEHGFILRYPLGKEYITSIQFEPWHFRYVGKEAAKLIWEEGLTLEEFWDKYVS